ncbi:MAG: glutaredoxin family protein [Chloroflexi bacterium]|nr:glutaredoxin family protein [Chloroflexota bacterium]
MPLAPVPDLILYGRPGCHLCEGAREAAAQLLEARARAGLAAPALIERDIETNPEWQRAFFETIPVVELGDRRVELVTSAGRIQRLLSDVLDA